MKLTIHGRFALLISLTSLLSFAQATRTWVSGVGDDANPCSRTAPCKTFAGAISKTAANGEISVLDPGGYGTVTITKGMTISGDGTLASALNPNTNGFVVAAGPTDRVILRNLSINGGGLGLNGIRFLSGGTLVVEKCTMTGFTQTGIDVALTAAGNLVVNDTTITGGLIGIRTNSLKGIPMNALLHRLVITGAGIGVDTTSGFTAISHSVVSQSSSIALLAEGAGTLTSESNMLTQNGTAMQAGVGATLRAINTSMYDNLTGFGCGGGTLVSSGDNHKSGNVGGPPTCVPTVLVPLQ
jgi:hypothetical protein